MAPKVLLNPKRESMIQRKAKRIRELRMIKTIILVGVDGNVMVLIRRSVARRNLDVVIRVGAGGKLVDLLSINVDR